MILAKAMAIEKLKCLKCGHAWIPRSEKRPAVCPSCGRPNWDESADGVRQILGSVPNSAEHQMLAIILADSDQAEEMRGFLLVRSQLAMGKKSGLKTVVEPMVRKRKKA